MNDFILFGKYHLLFLIIGTTICIFLLFFSTFLSGKLSEKFVKCLSLLILIIKILELYYRYKIYGEKIQTLLPLHLCNITLIIAILTIFLKSKFLFQFLYFWGIGALFALIFPEVYTINDFPTYSFFITHFFIIFAFFYCIFFYNFKATKFGLFSAFLFLNLFIFCNYHINLKLATNYMYVNSLPNINVPLGILGVWPYYILSVEVLYILITSILYFLLRKKTIKFKY